MHAERGQAFAEAFGDFCVEKWEQAIAAVDQRYLDSKRHEDGRVFAADHAAADYGEALRDAIHLQKCVGVEDVDVVEGDFWRTMRVGACGDEDFFGLQPARCV